MTPREALLDLVARVGTRDGAAVRISETDVRQWPAEAVSALLAHRLLVRARPARTVVFRLRSRLRHAGADDPRGATRGGALHRL